jgi:hypothetical protein
MLLPEGVDEKPCQRDEDYTKANADRVNNVQDICIFLRPKVQIGWVHVDPSNQN